MKISFSSGFSSAPLLALPYFDGERTISELPDDLKKTVEKRLAMSDITGTVGDTFSAMASGTQLILICVGKKESVTVHTIRTFGSLAVKCARQLQTGSLALLYRFNSDPVSFQTLAEGAVLGNYSERLYQTGKSREQINKQNVSTVHVSTKNTSSESTAAIRAGETIGFYVNKARDLNNAPNNKVHPETLAKLAQEIAKKTKHVGATVLSKKQLEQKKMGGILAVGQGSSREPKLIRLDYRPIGAKGKPIIFVGKGVCFDSGGYKLKPGTSIDDMFLDKMGAVTAIVALQLIAECGVKKNVSVVVPAVENLVSGSSYLPGDVVTTYSGKTVEIANTDAEGRMILSDALTYACELKPSCIVDLASLTGACMIALGDRYGGLFSNDEKLARRLLDAGTASDDLLWRLPLHPDYAARVKGTKTDLQNWDPKTGGLYAGASIGAHFLQEFVDPKIPWAHIDFLAPGFTKLPRLYDSPGATGYGVRLLKEFVEQWNM